MIPLTANQAALARFIVVERSEGRSPTYQDMADHFGEKSKSGVWPRFQMIEERLAPGSIRDIVPRGPDGARLRFIPVSALPAPDGAGLMADDGDIAFQITDALVARGLASIATASPIGVPGECEECGEIMPRLVGGRCGFCRDGRRPPLSFYDRAPAPSLPEPTKEETVPMTQAIPALASRKIAFTGAPLAAIEARAEAHAASFTQAANQLILIAVEMHATEKQAISNIETAAPNLYYISTIALLEELGRRIDRGVDQSEYDAQVRRASAAEERLASMKALLSA